jgi:hypothetical protein
MRLRLLSHFSAGSRGNKARVTDFHQLVHTFVSEWVFSGEQLPFGLHRAWRGGGAHKPADRPPGSIVGRPDRRRAPLPIREDMIGSGLQDRDHAVEAPG